MVCPYCGREMEEGYLAFKDNLIWSRKKKINPILPFGKEDMLFSSDSSTPFGSNRKAYRCTCCKKVVIDYGEV